MQLNCCKRKTTGAFLRMQVYLKKLHIVLLKIPSFRKMSGSLESTTDCPLPHSGEDSNPNDDGENQAGLSEFHWEDGGLPAALQRGMETLRVNRELIDVVLCVQGHDFPCHRAILASASQYFR